MNINEKMDRLENRTEEIANLVRFFNEKIKKLAEENIRLQEHIRYYEEESKQDKKTIREIRVNLQNLKSHREKLAGLLDRWENFSSN